MVALIGKVYSAGKGMVMNWLLVAVIVVLLIFSFVGHQKGMLRIIFSFGSLLIALLVSYMVTPYVTDFMKEKTGVYEWVQNKSMEFVRQEAQTGQNEEMQAGQTGVSQEVPADGADAATDAVRDGDIQRIADSMLEGLSLPDALLRQIDQAVADAKLAEETTIAQIETGIGSRLAELAMSAIGFVVTLLLVRLVLWIVYMALDMVSRLPVIHGINQTIGMVIGFAEGLLIVWIFFAFLTCIVQTQFGQQCLKMISESRLLSLLYEYNILRMLL